MPQKQLKKSTSQLAKKVNKKSNRIQRGMKATPKSHLVLKEREMQRKLAAKNIQNTEAQMALKAGQTGKLTIMKPIADKAIREKEQAEKQKQK
jgi:hypothetical protein